MRDTVNVTELYAVLRGITYGSMPWVQKHYAFRHDPEGYCGTSYCLAGHVLRRADIPLDWSHPSHVAGGGYTATYTDRGDGIDVVAARLLGITLDDAEDLFDENNTLADLWVIANRITHGAIEVPDGLGARRRTLNERYAA